MKGRVWRGLLAGWLMAGCMLPAWGYDADPAGDGAVLYERHCAACHGADGHGVDERYPSLHLSAADWAQPESLLRKVLGGSHRHMRATAMPDHGFLGNESLAAILDHVRRTFGEGGEPVTLEDVASARLSLVQDYHDRAEAEAAGAAPLAGWERPAGTWDPPPMSAQAYERARHNYERWCTGCHGVFRTGTAGNPLDPEWMRELGTAYLRQVIGFGTDRGMPTWLDEAGLGPEDIHDLALFLQHPLPPPASFDMEAVRASWTLHRAPADRPAGPAHELDLDDLFVVALHDPGMVLLIDGGSREPVARIDVNGPPHRITASPCGRYLQVVARNGWVTLVDLYAEVPERVASLRIGLEARALGHAGAGTPRLLGGAEWPPQFVLMDSETLEPLQRLDSQEDEVEESEAAGVADIIGSSRHGEFAAALRATGEILLLGHDVPMVVSRLDAEPGLRVGVVTPDGRHWLLPSDSRKLTVVDLEQRQVVAELPLAFAGAGQGVTYDHAEYGPVWATASLVSDQLLLLGLTAAEGRQWPVLELLDGPAHGSLFLATHPASPHLWMDTPLAEFGHASRELAVFRRDALGEGYRSLPIAGWADIEDGQQRVLQPAYSADGTEVWALVWNTQDAESAIVIVDDASLEPLEVLRFAGLITPMRLHSVAALRSAAAPAAAADGPGSAAEAEVPVGGLLYRQHCAACHGLHGEGDGPLAGEQDVVLKDLRRLSERNDGEFPRSFVRQIIDGRETRAAHGPAGKPVWGEFLGAADPEADRDAIDILVDFLEALQR